ncbi:MAG: hypothetical protein J0651_04150, partial [Actinobacteria bacterium]|nr:hypothetical protein [Actinomycetota bacterium]
MNLIMNHRKTVFAFVFTSILSIVLLSSFVVRRKELKPGCLPALNSAGINKNKKNEIVKITEIDLA